MLVGALAEELAEKPVPATVRQHLEEIRKLFNQQVVG